MTATTESTVSLDGLRVRIRQTGEGPPLLLINGIGAHLAMWGTVEQAFEGFQLIAFDAPGTGDSPVPRWPVSVRALARLATRVLDEFEIERADVLGYSMGGMITQQLAYDAPERLRRVVLVATSPGIGGTVGDLRALVNVATPARYFSARLYRMTIGSMAGGRARTDSMWVAAQGALRLRRAPSVRGYLSQLVSLTGWSSLPLLGSIEHPVLVVAGDDDPLTPLANSMLIAHMTPNGRLLVIPDEGHLMLLDEDSRALGAIRDYLEAPTLDRSATWRSATVVDDARVRTALSDAGLQPQPWGAVSAFKRRRWFEAADQPSRCERASDDLDSGGADPIRSHAENNCLFDPESRAVSVPPAAERRAQLQQRHPEWVRRTISEQFDAATAEHPEIPLVITDERIYSYREIKQWSERLAAGLVELGVQPGDHVALVMANYPQFIAAKFAIARAGAVTVPINFLFRAHELEYVLRQSDARVLITMDRFRDLDYLAALDAFMPGWETQGGGTVVPMLRDVVVFSPGGEARPGARSFEALESSGPAPVVAGDPDGHSDVLYTSGTTGSPKGVIFTHDRVLRTAYGAAHQRALPDGHRMLFSLPMYHVFGYVECLMATLFVGGAVIPQVQFEVESTLEAIARHQADELVCVPVMTQALLPVAAAGTHDLSSLRVVFSSGGAVPDTIWREIKDVFDVEEITTGYGQTETTAATTCTMPEGPLERLWTTNGCYRDAGVAGDPELGGMLAVYKTVDPATEADLARGEAGHLLVRGPIVTPGYYKKPDETELAFTADGWMRTGDIGTIDADGYLKLSGRIKESYRCGGEMVMPAEVESVLSLHAGVKQALIVGVPDARMGEVGCALIVPMTGERPEPQELIDLCKERLARFKVPRHVLFIEADEIPLTATGRPQKFLLATLARERLAAAEASAAASP
jgi:fatty-acyl-CoA synthase